MKQLMELILKTQLGKAILGLLLTRFLDHLKEKASRVHGGEGVQIVQFLHKLEPELNKVFIENQSHDEMFETIGHLEKEFMPTIEKEMGLGGEAKLEAVAELAAATMELPSDFEGDETLPPATV